MPLHQYSCRVLQCRHRMEELFGGRFGHAPGWLKCEACGGVAVKRQTYVVKTIGPVFEHLETFNKLLLTPQQRAQGVELKSAKQIEQYEAAKGLRRHDPNSPEYRHVREAELDDYATMRRIAAEDGREAALDYVDRSNITEATGWSSLEYQKWEEATADAEAQLAADPDRFTSHLASTLCDAGGTGNEVSTGDADC